MSDYISREAVLVLVEPDARPFLAERINQLPAADVRPKWISVEDELPEPYIPVLVVYRSYNTGEPLADMTAYLNGDGVWCWNGESSIVKVDITHWMPLPEPPNCGAKMTEEQA